MWLPAGVAAADSLWVMGSLWNTLAPGLPAGDSGFPELDLGEHLLRSAWDGGYLGRSWESRSQPVRTGPLVCALGEEGVWALQSKLGGLGPGCLLTCHVLVSINSILYVCVLICKMGLMQHGSLRRGVRTLRLRCLACRRCAQHITPAASLCQSTGAVSSAMPTCSVEGRGLPAAANGCESSVEGRPQP